MLNRLYNWYGKRAVRAVLGVIGVLALIGAYMALRGGDDVAPEEAQKLPVVTVQSVISLEETGSFTVVGTVRAVSEAKLQAEAGGRITAVNAQIGDQVSAGTILGSIENGSERAQLLQAEAAYESALAGAALSEVSVGDAENALNGAKNNAVTSYRNAYITVHDITLNTVDIFFGNPDSPTPGIRISPEGKSEYLNTSRYALGKTLTIWQKESTALTTEGDLDGALRTAEARTKDLTGIVDALVFAVGRAESSDVLKGKLVSDYMSSLNDARTSLNGTLSALTNAQTALTSARENVRRAQIGSTENTEVSLANAQVKQALGALRSAQVNYEKTLVRTPISGIVNSLNLTVGEFISVGQPAAIVANNGSLEISTALGEKDLARVRIGDTVKINNTVEGTITRVAPAIDPVTGKSEVKISTANADSLKNGSTVSVAFTHKNDASATEAKDIVVPLKSLKMLASGSVAFGVTPENKLVSYPVVLGTILGDSVQILEGLSLETEIVTDARGLKEGDEVTVIQK
jgi:RND family efflux transporter MFP subunit